MSWASVPRLTVRVLWQLSKAGRSKSVYVCWREGGRGGKWRRGGRGEGTVMGGKGREGGRGGSGGRKAE